MVFQNRADDAAIVKATELLEGITERLEGIGSLLLVKVLGSIVALLSVLVIALAGWVWDQNSRTVILENTIRTESEALQAEIRFRAEMTEAMNALRTELSG